MSASYPLVETRAYGRAQSRGTLFRTRQQRDDSALPVLEPFQARVFRVGDDFVEQNHQITLGDDVLVNATSVTVVDKRGRVPVVTEVAIPSADVGLFTVRVSFLCTVRDATAVVRDGVTDAKALLEGYVLGIPGLDEEGAGLPTTETARVRRQVGARLQACMELEPPPLSGLEVSLATVDVLSPEDMADHLRAIEESRREADLAKALHKLDQLKEDHQREKKLLVEQHRQELDSVTKAYTRRMEFQKQDDELEMNTRQNDHAREEVAKNLDAIGRNPVAAGLYALANGGIDSGDFASRLADNEEREIAWRQDQAYRDREDARYLVDRNDHFRELDYHAAREDSAARREEAGRRWDKEYDATERERAQQREDSMIKWADDRDWSKQVLLMQDQLIKMVIDRGQADEMRVDIVELFNRIGQLPDRPSLPQTDSLGLPAPDSAEPSAQSERVVRQDTAPSDDDKDIGDAGLEDRGGHR